MLALRIGMMVRGQVVCRPSTCCELIPPSLARDPHKGCRDRKERRESWDLLHFLRSSKPCVFIDWPVTPWAALPEAGLKWGDSYLK